MSQDAAATFSRTLAAYQFPAANDITLKGRSLTPSGIVATTLDGITAGLFALGANARFTNPAFLAVADISFEMLITPTTMTTDGWIVRAGSTTVTTDTGIACRIFRLGTTPETWAWSMSKRGVAAGRPTPDAVQFTTGTQALVFGQTYHVVFVAADNVLNRIFVNGTEIPVTHRNVIVNTSTELPAGALSGPIPILGTYELAIGDPSTTQATFLGTLGRLIIYPYAVTPAQATASRNLQIAQDVVIGLGLPTAAGASNHGPVAVPFIAPGTVSAGASIDINTAGRSFDADSNPLTAVAHPTAPTQGVSSITGTGLLRYTPNGGTGGPGVQHIVPFRIRDLTAATGLQSSSFVRVNVTSTLTTPAGWPYPQSQLFNRLTFNGALSRYGPTPAQEAAGYDGNDQWPQTEEASGALLFVGADGQGFTEVTKTEWRVSRVTGTPPTGLSGTDLAMRIDLKANENPDSGFPCDSKPSGILAFGTNQIAVWYQFLTIDSGPYTGWSRHTHVALSANGGANFTLNRALNDFVFRESTNEDLAVAGVLQLGAGYASGPTFVDREYIYVYLSNVRQLDLPSYAAGSGAQNIFLSRVKWTGTGGSVNNLTDPGQYSIMTGLNAAGVPIWGAAGNFGVTKAIVFNDPNGMALNFNVHWHSAINKFVATYIHADTDTNTFGSQGIAVAIADTPWTESSWQMIAYGRDLNNAETSEADNYLSVSAPSRWNNGTTMHFAVSTYVSGGTIGGEPGDNLIVTPVTLS